MNKIYITYDVSYGLNPKSLKPFWVYERTNELETILNSWFNKKS